VSLSHQLPVWHWHLQAQKGVLATTFTASIIVSAAGGDLLAPDVAVGAGGGAARRADLAGGGAGGDNGAIVGRGGESVVEVAGRAVQHAAGQGACARRATLRVPSSSASCKELARTHIRAQSIPASDGQGTHH
jgi:hypothetical protein